MSLPTETKQLLLHRKPTSLPDPSLDSPTSTFKLHTKPLPSPLPPGTALLATRHISNDPAQRGWISATFPPSRLYTTPVALNTPMRSRNIFAVLALAPSVPAALAATLPPGTLVTLAAPAPDAGWVAHAVVPAALCTPCPPLPRGLPPTHLLGALGMPALAAYIGLTEIARLARTDTLVVSGAAGATGSLAVQLAKRVLGCARVVGIAGGARKCAWVVGALGADACVDYRAAAFEADLRAVTEGEQAPTVYFDNVGGRVLDVMLTRLRTGGRVVACGAISAYNCEGEGQPFYNWMEVISSRLSIKGFIVLDYMDRAAEVQQILWKALEEGTIVLDAESETVVETRFEDVPRTWMKLFEGGNVGKLVTTLVE